MRFAWVRLGIAGCAAGLILVISTPGRAADQSGFTTVVAEELDKRSKEPQQQGLNDTRVRVMLTYAFSLIPAETPGPDGKGEPVDKSDFKTFVIPNDDARQVIRAATRSAYADVCGLPELGEANLKALMTQESKKNWTHKQMLMIEALHLFALSYFTGAAQIVEDGPEPTGDEAAASKDEESGKPVQPRVTQAPPPPKPRVTQAPPPPKCPPEQKAKVENAIRAYVEAVQAN